MVKIEGHRGEVRWSYLPALTFGPWSYVGVNGQGTLTAQIVSRDEFRMQQVVDVISGTSAGGINGVFLAKAIAHDLSQQSLRDLWFDEADIGKLLVGPRWLDPFGVKGKLAWFVLRALLARGRVAPPLRGDQMCRLLYGALSAMTPGSTSPARHIPITVTPNRWRTFSSPIVRPSRGPATGHGCTP